MGGFFSIRSATTCLAAIVLAGAGCGPPPPPVVRDEVALAGLAQAYLHFALQHGGKAPANEEEFRDYLREQPQGRREALGLKHVDAPWISPRDGQPLVIAYGKTIANNGSENLIVVYERTGKDGTRWVVNAVGTVQQVDEGRFRQLVPDAR